MTVIGLAGGSPLLHSPGARDAELRRELDTIGRVRFTVVAHGNVLESGGREALREGYARLLVA